MNADATRPTSPSPRTVGCALAALLAIAAAPVRAQPTLTPEDRRCMECHGQAHIAELSPAERLAMVGTWLDPDHAAEAPPDRAWRR